jgi:hypothetical protein
MRGKTSRVERSRPNRRRHAIGLMVLGVALAVPCWIITGASVGNSLKIHADSAVPGSFDVSLARGEWEIYELTGTVSGSSVGPFSYTKQTEGPVTIDSADIRVTGPDALPVATRNRFSPTSFQTYRTGSKIYTGVASFELTVSGHYQISVVAAQPGRVIVARPPFSGIASVLGWIVGGVMGAVALIAGLILLILDLDQRRRALVPTSAAASSPGQRLPFQPPTTPTQPPQRNDQHPAPSFRSGMPAGGVPPGWHPDPSGRQQFRYWNGHSWTEHVSTGGIASTDPL